MTHCVARGARMGGVWSCGALAIGHWDRRGNVEGGILFLAPTSAPRRARTALATPSGCGCDAGGV